jgi:hypothetical protein
VERFREVGGFDLDNIPRVQPVAVVPLPEVIPCIDHKYSRSATLLEPVVAIPLYELFHMATGEPLVRTREELAGRFLIREDATVVATGVARDSKLEAWWAFTDRHRVLTTLRDLGIALVTAPNYSLFLDVPRPDNLHGMKRIGLSWAELMDAGVPAALHLNARTDHDYRRWRQFIVDRGEVELIAFEFGTGAGFRGRIDWHVDQLCRLADRVDRDLVLVVRGGIQVLARLRRHFSKVILIETDAFAKTRKRRRATLSESGRLKWPSEKTPKGAPLDDLLAHNISLRRTALLSSDFTPTLREGDALGRPGSAQRRHRQAGQRGLVGQLDLPLETRTVPADFKGMITAAKSEVAVMRNQGAK